MLKKKKRKRKMTNIFKKLVYFKTKQCKLLEIYKSIK